MNFETLKSNLEKNGFTVSHFATGKEAAEYLNGKIDGKSVGIGGSVTIDQMGLDQMLGTHNKVVWHQKGGSRREAATTDVYLLSANGVAETGEIINIDGTGNRLASALFGHEEVYYVIGSNKVAEDFDKALWRARNIAAPKNAQRLGRKTPCAKNGDKCYNCSSPERICRALNVIWKAPGGAKYSEVIIVDEPLGY